MSYKLRIILEYFQPKIGRRIRIFSLGRKNNILIKKKKECSLHRPNYSTVRRTKYLIAMILVKLNPFMGIRIFTLCYVVCWINRF